jgi:hypothetical protein
VSKAAFGANLTVCLTTAPGYGAEVSWAVLEVVPRIYLAFHGELPEGFRHSVLYVRTAAGESFVFDCTGEQFGWPTSDWLTADITKNMKDARASWDDGAVLLKVTRRNIFLTDGGYWKGLIKSLNVMFDKFNWDSMAEMDRVNMENQVQEEAERRAQAAAVETWG